MKPLNSIFTELFRVSTGLYLLLFIVERLRPGTVSLYLNPDFVLIIAAVSGLINVLTLPANTTASAPQSLSSLLPLGFIFNICLFLFLRDLGVFGLIISLLSSILVIGFFYLSSKN